MNSGARVTASAAMPGWASLLAPTLEPRRGAAGSMARRWPSRLTCATPHRLRHATIVGTPAGLRLNRALRTTAAQQPAALVRMVAIAVSHERRRGENTPLGSPTALRKGGFVVDANAGYAVGCCRDMLPACDRNVRLRPHLSFARQSSPSFPMICRPTRRVSGAGHRVRSNPCSARTAI